MNIPKFDFKALVQKIGILRNYSSLLLPISILLVSVLLFIPTQLMSRSLRHKIAEQSVTLGKKIKSLSKNTVVRDQWKVEEKYQQAYAEDANQIALLAKQTTQRQLLSYKIFPQPKDTSPLIFEEFGQRFCDGIKSLITNVKGGDAPTEAELERSLQTSDSRFRFSKTRSSKVSGDLDAAIKDVLCRAKAKSASVYVAPTNVSGYEFWKEHKYAGMEQAVEDCWSWQLAYWIIEDVFDTIVVCNSGSKSVFTSPVKRLLNVSFGDRYSQLESVAGDKKPRYVFSPYENITASSTKRVSNPDIDVVYFNLVVVVTTKDVLPFMQQLCSAKQHIFKGFLGSEAEQVFKHNQITILESNVYSVEQENEIHYLYRYGDDAIVELYLICEYIFNKNSYDEIKPETFKVDPLEAQRGKRRR